MIDFWTRIVCRWSFILSNADKTWSVAGNKVKTIRDRIKFFNNFRNQSRAVASVFQGDSVYLYAYWQYFTLAIPITSSFFLNILYLNPSCLVILMPTYSTLSGEGPTVFLTRSFSVSLFFIPGKKVQKICRHFLLKYITKFISSRPIQPSV